MRFSLSLRAALLAAVATYPALIAGPALAQTSQPGSAPAAAPASADPVVAKVNGQEIRMSDLQEAAQDIPPQMRNMPQQMLLPMLIDQLIDRKASAIATIAQGLDKDPGVIRALTRAREQVLQNALLTKELGPIITEDAIRARFQRDYANKPGEAEVHARHILVPTEDNAKRVIAELKRGGDFTAIAKKESADTGSAKEGGDLGFFKRADMVPEFAEAAFKMKAGQVSDAAVKTQFGWHVIKVEEIRQAPAPKFEEVAESIRDLIVQEGVRRSIERVRNTVKVEKFNPDGSSQSPLDSATPPPARR